MSRNHSFAIPPRVPPVEPELLASAIFIFGEYLASLEPASRDSLDSRADEDEGEDTGERDIDTAAVLNVFVEELGTSVTETLSLYMRVTALYRLLAASPTLARMAVEEPDLGGRLTEDALVAAARLDLHVRRVGDEGSADFDPREFRDALSSA